LENFHADRGRSGMSAAAARGQSASTAATMAAVSSAVAGGEMRIADGVTAANGTRPSSVSGYLSGA